MAISRRCSGSAEAAWRRKHPILELSARPRGREPNFTPHREILSGLQPQWKPGAAISWIKRFGLEVVVKRASNGYAFNVLFVAAFFGSLAFVMIRFA